MKVLSMLIWVGQFGFSVLFPTCIFLMTAVWLRQRFGLGLWVVAVLGILGLLTSLRTAKACLQSMLREMERGADRREPPPAFNEHK